jgi:biopolymer transport protein ExbD
MKLHSDIPSEEVQIQIIPLIDVIFCILTFFILAALQLTRQQAIGVDLPRASTGTPQMREMLVVTISPTGQLFLDKDLVDRLSLRQRLEQYRQSRPDGLLVLNASKLAFYNDVVQVLDVMRSVGGDRVALSTLPAEANQTPGATPVPSPTVPSSIFGNPTPVPTTPGSGLPGGVIPNQSLPGQSLPGQSLPGQSLPGQSLPGQSLPGQSPGSSGIGPVFPGTNSGSFPNTGAPSTPPTTP